MPENPMIPIGFFQLDIGLAARRAAGRQQQGCALRVAVVQLLPLRLALPRTFIHDYDEIEASPESNVAGPRDLGLVAVHRGVDPSTVSNFIKM
ncbi:unnamed protein product [Trichogramma brassicae]|uniref:Uncharacterized protein n=1 Tax=Trichogramma brassicae TaxID=86971 RepID=A0A6H5IAW6_9HYME|nr:unnamed protein product [Trichogramma brassicae]